MKKTSILFSIAFSCLFLRSVSAQFTLQLLHASDLEGGVESINSAPNFAAIVDHFKSVYPDNTVTLSSGDNWLVGPFFSASNQVSLRDTFDAVYNGLYNLNTFTNLREGVGRVDISIMNVLGFDASCFGNHEFDPGTSIVQEIIAPNILNNGADARWLGAQFPYLSANLDFSNSNLAYLYESTIQNSTHFIGDANDWLAASNTKKIAPSTIVQRGIHKIGVVGATTQRLPIISSPGDVSVVGNPSGDDMAQLASVLQPYINALELEGCDIIIVVTHLQDFTLEQELAGLLEKVDIIVAGGSDHLLANPSNTLHPGDVAQGTYPFNTQNADSDPCLIVSTDGQYSYVGRLVVEFDADGKVIPATVDPAVSGAFASMEAVVDNLWGMDDPFQTGSMGYWVDKMTQAVNDIVIEKDGNTFGFADVFLDGRRNTVRTQEANMGNLTADANLWVAQGHDSEVVASIKNGGGIRAEIGEIIEVSPGVYEYSPNQANPISGKMEKEISQLDIENTLKFNNLLSIVELTASGLVEIVEHGISAYAPGATPGQFPQVGGMRFSFDPAANAGERIVNLAIVDNDGDVLDSIVIDGMIHGDPERTLKIVTLNFMANGGDGYPFVDLTLDRVDLETVLTNPGVAEFAIPGSEQDALAEFLAEFYATTSAAYDAEETTQEEDERIQILSFRPDAVYEGNVSLEEIMDQELSVVVYPNPADALVRVSSEQAIEYVELFDLSGNKILEFSPNVINETVVDTNPLFSGVYILVVHTNQKSVSLRLVRN